MYNEFSFVFLDSTSEEHSERCSDDDVTHAWLTLPLVSECCVSILHQADASKPQIPLFLAAPIQGTAEPLAEVARELGGTVYGLQYPPHMTHLSITHMAQVLVEVSGRDEEFGLLCTYPNLGILYIG